MVSFLLVVLHVDLSFQSLSDPSPAPPLSAPKSKQEEERDTALLTAKKLVKALLGPLILVPAGRAVGVGAGPIVKSSSPSSPSPAPPCPLAPRAAPPPRPLRALGAAAGVVLLGGMVVVKIERGGDTGFDGDVGDRNGGPLILLHA